MYHNNSEPRPVSDHKRIVEATSRHWDREGYSKQYGKSAMVEVDACRTAARDGDERMLRDAMKRLSQALWKDNKRLFGVSK